MVFRYADHAIKPQYYLGKDQRLGFWNTKTKYVGYDKDKGDAVHNSDFRAYRDANKKGGDYLIFSDLERHAVDPPLTIKMGKR